MLKIRLTRKGKKNSAFFRVVVAEHTAPIKGKFLENLGFLNPHTKEKEFKADRIKYWIEKGAQCSDTVHNLLVSNNIISGPKKAVKIKKKPVDEKKTEETKPAETPEVKQEEKATEKPIEITEPKKEESKTEAVKPEPEKKEAEKKEGEESASSAGEEKKSDEKK
jgi:small subunit ribosomal protein S16